MTAAIPTAYNAESGMRICADSIIAFSGNTKCGLAAALLTLSGK